MARAKGMGNLQLEKNGWWTLRVGIDGKRFSRSTRTQNREQAERFAQRFLGPLGLGEKRLPLAEVWFEYERSPHRRDLAASTLHAKRQVWMHFAKWMERGHLEVSELGEVTSDMVGEYLRCLRASHSATTYNNHVCVLREVCRTLYGKAGVREDPWEGVRLLSDDSHTRREFSVEELAQVVAAAGRYDRQVRSANCHLLFLIGIYTGLRLGDCCTLEWRNVNFARKVVQVIPRKTRKHAHGRPVTIPIHPVLEAALREAARLAGGAQAGGHVLPQLAQWYLSENWRVGEALRRIFKMAGIVTNVRVEGRRYKAPDATFHSLRHTFVSIAANAGVPLPVVQSIVGHTSTAMTRHYYHENESMLWQAVEALPTLGADATERVPPVSDATERVPPVSDATERVPPVSDATERVPPVSDATCGRLKEVEALWAEGTLTPCEYAAIRTRILGSGQG